VAYIKKGVGVCSQPIPGTQALALPNPHRIDNAVSPRQYVYTCLLPMAEVIGL